MILVSSCLLGLQCRYDAKVNTYPQVLTYLKGKAYMAVCPEQMGGLSTPRPPAEILSRKPLLIKNNEGLDVTAEFERGVSEVEKLIKDQEITLAILKAKSPSCGCKVVYDGTFTGVLVAGQGLLAKHLNDMGIKVINEKDVL